MNLAVVALIYVLMAAALVLTVEIFRRTEEDMPNVNNVIWLIVGVLAIFALLVYLGVITLG